MAATLNYTSDELDAMAQRANCCIGHMGHLRQLADKAGNASESKKYMQFILAVNNVVEALCCYDPDSSTNILSATEIQKLLETSRKICGCCCSDVALQTDIK